MTGTHAADTRAAGTHATDAHMAGTHAAGTHTTVGAHRTPTKVLRELTFEAAKLVTGRKNSARVNSRGTFAAAPSQRHLRSGAIAATPPQRCLRSGAIAATPPQQLLRSGTFSAAPQRDGSKNGNRPASAPFARRSRLCYARSSPLLAITFWYQAKLSLRERSSVPLPWLSLST